MPMVTRKPKPKWRVSLNVAITGFPPVKRSLVVRGKTIGEAMDAFEEQAPDGTLPWDADEDIKSKVTRLDISVERLP